MFWLKLLDFFITEATGSINDQPRKSTDDTHRKNIYSRPYRQERVNIVAMVILPFSRDLGDGAPEHSAKTNKSQRSFTKGQRSFDFTRGHSTLCLDILRFLSSINIVSQWPEARDHPIKDQWVSSNLCRDHSTLCQHDQKSGVKVKGPCTKE